MIDADILIAEDSATQADRLRGHLESRGYRVRRARDGAEALELLHRSLPDLVITDVLMPRMDGYELCSHIKSDERVRHLPVILLTSLAQPEDVIRSLDCGADNFIRKPYDAQYLLSRVSNILTSRHLRQTGKLQLGLEVYLGGARHFIDADRQQILDFLLSTYEDVSAINAELERRSAQLERRNDELEAALLSLAAETRRAQNLASVNRAVLDATAEGIALLPEDGSRQIVNAELLRLLERIPGVSAEASLRQNVRGALNIVEDPQKVAEFARSLGDDPDARGELDVELPSVDLALRVFSAPVRDDSGGRIGRLVVFRDITREREVDRLKSELVATVSHELRTPLAAVLGFAELLHTRDIDEDQRRQYVGTIASEARRLSGLVDDFLDLYRIEHGRFAIRTRPLDMREVVRRQVEIFAGQSSRHEIAAELPETPLEVAGDEDRLAQVMANLMSNAIKYSPRGGRVEVRAARRNGGVEVSVRDQGIGIPPSKHDRVFTKFFRVDSSETRSIGGTGLGLALCREIVEAHGGEIGFTSTPGGGSTFRVILPTADASQDTSAKIDGPPAAAQEEEDAP